MKYAIWVAVGLSALAFAAAGVAKLMGVPMVHASFANMGLPSWFGYFIGLCELAGAVGLLIRRLSGLAAAGLAIIMVGAVYYHLVYDIATLAPAAVLLVLTVFIFVRRRGEISLTA